MLDLAPCLTEKKPVTEKRSRHEILNPEPMVDRSSDELML